MEVGSHGRNEHRIERIGKKYQWTKAALVDREAFLALLRRQGLSALWVITGEKSVYGGSDAARGFGGRVLHTGVYRMKNNAFECQMYKKREHPTKEQLQHLFGDKPIPPGIMTS